jgi:DNA polymerase-3 subunit gamma/tau
MTYEPLHHKYRPRTFSDLVGQEAIATTLSNALTSERIAPAYLFTGPRGTGKTSSARILAKSLNCLSSESPTPIPCGRCEVCRAIANGSALDVIEIDAASNTGVDNIREIIERAQFAPVQCRYKVYVIDECHMLSTAAFNALLKTLEEPPDRVIFVLATTDPQRVLPTIISRCQRFDYRRIPLDAMVGHLEKIARLESIDIELEAITLISQIANGGLRDAESLLDQLSLLAGTITSDRIWELVGAVPERDLLSLLKAIRSDVADAVIEQCRHLMNRGKEPLIVLQNLAGFYLNLLLAKTAPNRPEMVAVTAPTWQELCTEARGWTVEEILYGQRFLKESENQLKNTTQPRLWLEITLLSLLPAARVAPTVTDTARSRPAAASPPPPAPVEPKSVATTPPPPPAPIEPKIESKPVTPSEPRENPPNPIVNGETDDIWQKVIAIIEPATTRSLLRQQGRLLHFEESVARVGISSEQLLKMARPRLANIEAAFEAVFQRRIKVHLQVGTAIDPSVSVSAREEVPKARETLPDPTGRTSEAIARVAPNPPETVTEAKPIERETPPASVVIETPPPPPVPENGHRKTPIEPVISPPPEPRPVVEDLPKPALVPPVEESEEIADDEIIKAARSLAKFFEGEIVSVGQKDIESPKAIVKEEKIVTNAPNVRGRPDISEVLETLDDEEDIPF